MCPSGKLFKIKTKQEKCPTKILENKFGEDINKFYLHELSVPLVDIQYNGYFSARKTFYDVLVHSLLKRMVVSVGIEYPQVSWERPSVLCCDNLRL